MSTNVTTTVHIPSAVTDLFNEANMLTTNMSVARSTVESWRKKFWLISEDIAKERACERIDFVKFEKKLSELEAIEENVCWLITWFAMDSLTKQLLSSITA